MNIILGLVTIIVLMSCIGWTLDTTHRTLKRIANKLDDIEILLRMRLK